MTFRGLCWGVNCSMMAQVGNLSPAMGVRIQVGKDLSYHSPVISHENMWMPGSIVLVILIMIQKLFYIAWWLIEYFLVPVAKLCGFLFKAHAISWF
jgi:hypothetical protein